MRLALGLVSDMACAKMKLLQEITLSMHAGQSTPVAQRPSSQ